MGWITDVFSNIGGAIFGDLFSEPEVDQGDINAQREADRGAAEVQQSKNIELQREFAQNGIRWRTEDARAAGLHPLYALGGTGATFQPNPIVMSSPAPEGQNVSGAAMATQTGLEREIQEAQLRKLEAETEKEHAMSAYYASEAARVGQRALQSAPMPGSLMPAAPIPPDLVKINPAEITSPRSNDRSIVAGPGGPGFREFAVYPEVNALLPDANSISEAIESLSESGVMMWLTYLRNLKEYGGLWPVDMWKGEKYRRPLPPTRVERELSEALSGRHDYPGGVRYYAPRIVEEVWQKYHRPLRRRSQ